METKSIPSQANGLRNSLVHCYNRADDLLAFESINALLPELLSFRDEVDQWIIERL